MFVTGFIAQMVDGSLGMGYGTISTTFLLANGVNPAIVSSRVHSARVFSSGVSGYSHHRFGNINKKLFRSLVIPGIMGAVIGATLAVLAQKFKYADYIRIPLSIYTLYLGYFILQKAFKKKQVNGKVKRAGWLSDHRRIYGFVCWRRMGNTCNQHINFEKKKSALCYRFCLSCRIFCSAMQLNYFFYFLKKPAVS